MSETVSFRCSGELAEFLEQEAQRRMTTKSQVAQTLIAEKVREMQGEDTDNEVSAGENGGGDGSDADAVLARHPEGSSPSGEGHWYELDDDAKNNYAVFTESKGYGPDNELPDRKYFKTKDGAAKALKKYWE